MKTSTPLALSLPDYGVLFAESAHDFDFALPERADDFHKVIYVLRGSVSFRPAHQPTGIAADAGTVITIPGGGGYFLRDPGPSTLLLLVMSNRFLASDADLPALWSKLAGHDGRCIVLNRPARLRLESMWRHAMLEEAHARVGAGLSVRLLAAQAVLHLARMTPAILNDDAPLRVETVAREMAETFFDEWNVDRAAERAALSRRRFTEVFRQQFGRTFAEYLIELRLKHAAALLEAGDLSVVEAVFSSGFNDLSHFYRAFRSRYGMPPGLWGERKRRAETSPLGRSLVVRPHAAA